MQEILILSWFEELDTPNQREFLKYAKPHQQVTIWPFRKLFLAYDGTNVTLSYPPDKRQLTDFDVVHIAGWRRDYDLGKAVAAHLEANNIPFVGRTVLDWYPRTKCGEMLALATAGVPYPLTYYTCINEDLPMLYEWAEKHHGLHFPVIVKGTEASSGCENYLVHDMAELRALPLQDHLHYLLQPFIPNDSDYRVLVFGGRAKLVIKRTRLAGATQVHQNNTAKGARIDVLEPAEVDAPILAMAGQAARALKRQDMTGVDVMQDSDSGAYYVLEVNKTPSLSIGAPDGIARKLGALYDYLDELAGGNGQ